MLQSKHQPLLNTKIVIGSILNAVFIDRYLLPEPHSI